MGTTVTNNSKRHFQLFSTLQTITKLVLFNSQCNSKNCKKQHNNNNNQSPNDNNSNVSKKRFKLFFYSPNNKTHLYSFSSFTNSPSSNLNGEEKDVSKQQETFCFFLSQTNWRGRCFQTSNNKKRLKLFYKTNSSFFPNQIGEEEDVSKQQETFFLFPKWRGGRGLQAPTTNGGEEDVSVGRLRPDSCGEANLSVALANRCQQNPRWGSCCRNSDEVDWDVIVCYPICFCFICLFYPLLFVCLSSLSMNE